MQAEFGECGERLLGHPRMIPETRAEWAFFTVASRPVCGVWSRLLEYHWVCAVWFDASGGEAATYGDNAQ
jgi:hypothetical protein